MAFFFKHKKVKLKQNNVFLIYFSSVSSTAAFSNNFFGKEKSLLLSGAVVSNGAI